MALRRTSRLARTAVAAPLCALLVAAWVVAPAARSGAPAGRRAARTSLAASTSSRPPAASTASSRPPSAPTTTTLAGQGGAIYEQGGTVTVAVPSLPANLNPSVPAGANRVTAMVTEQIWPQAFTVSQSLAPVLDSNFLSSAYLTNVSPQTVVYTIVPGARWSDGTPITAADFSYLWHEQLVYGPELPAEDPVAGYQDITSVTGSNGGKTVTVVFSHPYAEWSSLFSALVPAQVASAHGFATAFATADSADYVSGGPYEVSTYVPGRELVLVRNPHYWGPPAHVASIVFKVVAGDRAVLAALRDGTVDMGTVDPSSAAARLVASKDGSLAVQTGLGPTLWQLVFNLARPTLAQPVLRQAVAKAVDRTEILADTVDLAAPGTPTSGNRLFPSGAADSQGNAGGYEYADDAAADQLLESQGYTAAPNGLMLTPSGAPLTLTVVGPKGSPLVTEIEAQLQAQLLAAGITLRVTNEPESRLLAITLPTGRYEMALAPYAVSPYPADTEELYSDPVGPAPLDVTASSPATPSTVPSALPGRARPSEVEPGAVAAGAVSRDVNGFDDPTVTALYAEAAQSLAPPTSDALYNEIDQILWRDLPTLPLFQVPVSLVSAADIVNVVDTDTWAGPMWNAEDWIIQLSPVPSATTTTSAGSS